MGHGWWIWRKNILLHGSPRHTHTKERAYRFYAWACTCTGTRTYTGMKENRQQAGFRRVRSADKTLGSEDVN